MRTVKSQVESMTGDFKETFDIDVEVTPNGVWFETKGGPNGHTVLAGTFITATTLEWVADACREMKGYGS